MNLPFQSDFLTSLGWSLFDSLWQMGILWVLYQLIARTVKLTAASRYNLSLLSLQGGTILFFGGFIARLLSTVSSDSRIDNWAFGLLSISEDSFESFLPFISIAYIVIAALLISRIILQIYRVNTLGTKGLIKADPELRVFVQQLSGQMGIKKNVRVFLSSLVDSPLTVGFFKPLILLPVAAMNSLDMKQTEAILLHELEHIRRNDYLVNLSVVFSESILFFNPFARFLAQTIRKERENCCDDKVLDFNYPNNTYASALLILEKNRHSWNSALINAVGTHRFLLLNRVERILTGKQIERPDHVKTCLAAGILGLISFVGLYQNNREAMKVKPIAADAKTLWNLSLENTIPVAETSFGHYQFPELVLNIESDERSFLAEQQSHAMHAIEAGFYDEIEEPADVADVAEFASTRQTREFSILEPPAPPAPPMAPVGVHPYVPASSFDFELIEDTLMPALKATVTIHQIKAKEALEKAIAQLEQECKNNAALEPLLEVEINRMKSELTKSIEQINWSEMEQQIALAKQQTANNLKVQAEFEKFQRNKVLHQEKLNKLKEQILLDRLNIKEKKIVVL